MKHNNVIPNGHFHKDWQNRVRTWFNQPMRKKRRRAARSAKAARIAPRPVDGALRPVIRCPTNKYNMYVRLGRGFTPDELKEAGITVKTAPTIGISVDYRRKNRSVDAMQDNVQRLKEYKAKLLLFPKNAAKPKEGDASKDDLSMVTQHVGKILPIVKTTPSIEVRPITEEERNTQAYRALRIERSNAKYDGRRKKRAADKAAAEEEKTKK